MKRKLNVTKIIFLIYCLLLIWLILFKMTFSFRDIQWFSGTRSVNLIPFCYMTDVGNIQTKEVVMNVLVFIPMGIYLKMLTMSSKKAILFGFASSLLFEVSQFLFAIGASDITDIITNTFGTIVGVCLYVLLKKIFADKQKMDRIINGMAAIVLTLFGVLTVLLFLANQS